MTFDVRDARILLACAQSRSIGRAAKALNMAQPAVTRALNRLEAQLDAPLFERTTRGVEPTPYGAALLPYAELMVSESGQAEELIRQMRGAGRGLVRIGGVGSVAGGLLVEALTLLRESHPEVAFSVTEELEDRLVEGLKTGAVDLAVLPDSALDDEIRLAAEESFHDEVRVYVRAGHPAAGRALTLAEAARLDWAMPPQATPITREWMRRFHDQRIEPGLPVLQSRSTAVIRAAVLAGDLACWMPEPVLLGDLAQGQVVALRVPHLDWRRSFKIYRRRRGLLPPSADLLLAALRQLAG
ncbi:MAG: LysR family transcriptional regulator [Proteobacteria bacterium]|nr:LysR family transcriptional regulator [Pseudomonadota bacterium]